jgi:hypothetical protein
MGRRVRKPRRTARSQGGAVAGWSESSLRPAEECRESAPNAERNRTSNEGMTSANGGACPRGGSVGFGVNALLGSAWP